MRPKALDGRESAQAATAAARRATLAMLVATLALATQLAATAPVAQAAPAWLEPEYASELLELGYFYEIPRATVMDDEGNATVLWRAVDGADYRVGGAMRLAGGEFEQLGWLSAAGSDAQQPRVGVDAGGQRVVVWGRFIDSSYWGIEHVEGTAEAGFGSPQVLSVPDRPSYFPEIAVNGRGDAAAVWERTTYAVPATPTVIQASVRPAGGGFGPVETVSEPGALVRAGHPQVAVDGAGNAIAVWEETQLDGQSIVKGAVREAGGTGFGSHQTISEVSEEETYPQVAVAEPGTGVAVWTQTDAGSERIYAATVTADGSFQAATPISPPSPTTFSPRVKVDPGGNATAVWIRDDGSEGEWRVEAADRPAGASFGPPSWLSQEGIEARGPELAFDDEGNLIVAWGRLDGDIHRIQAVSRPAGGEYGGPKWISSPTHAGTAARIDFDRQGNAIVTWVGSFDGLFRIEAAGYDAAGPKLRDLTIPSYGGVGKPLSFSVAPLDVWSAVVSTRWTFGDGATAEGTSATRKYRRPGIYTVRVTSTDAEGNWSSAQGQVRIVATTPISEERVEPWREDVD